MKLKHGFICGLLSLMLVACGADQDSDLHQFIESVSKRPGRTIEPIPDFKKTASFKYPNKLKRRDPFSAKGKRQAKDMSAPDLNRKKQPLEEFPIDGLSFVGTLSRGVHHWALIRTPKEQVFKVTIGQYMGQNYGRVVKITPKTLTLVESIRVNGRWQKKNIELKLK